MTESNCDSPVALCQYLWPDAMIWSKPREMLNAVRHSAETYVQAGNELSKDWTLGRLAIGFMLSPWTWYGREHFLRIDGRTDLPKDAPEYVRHQRRVVTTSVKDKHLDVLWGEIGNAWRTCSVDLGRVFVMTDKEIRFREEADSKNCSSYCVGVVSGSENSEGLSGHHAPYTLAMIDEASGSNDGVHTALTEWCARLVVIGNPKPCSNFYKEYCQAGDLRIA